MSNDLKLQYGTEIVPTVTHLLSLASDGTPISGWQSDAVDNTSNRFRNYAISAAIKTGTTPTVGKIIQVYGYANLKVVSGTPTYPDTITGAEGVITLSSVDVLNACCRMIGQQVVTATSNLVYPFAPVTIEDLFGYTPKFFGVIVLHNTVAALNSAGSFINITPTYEQII